MIVLRATATAGDDNIAFAVGEVHSIVAVVRSRDFPSARAAVERVLASQGFHTFIVQQHAAAPLWRAVLPGHAPLRRALLHGYDVSVFSEPVIDRPSNASGQPDAT